ncbi:MAG: protein kinase [Bacteroidales bacterium]|nr:protein kinase [Bacteroidales bacterium]MBQ6101244.1 protein kinase [Bacteroidales bacterium]
MADNIFSNFEPANETTVISKDYDNIKPFYSSAHGYSRLFTAVYQGKKVIIKTLKPEFAQDEQCRKNLKKEYEYTSQLDNRFVRRALGFESIQGLGESIILEYIDGKSLAEHVRVGTLNEKQVKSVIVDLCDGLNYMHRNGIIHCDLKPENVLITTNDLRVKIIDIGLPETNYKTDHELLIKENEFIAPELFKGEEADPRSDVYSLGKIIEFIIARNMLNQFSNVATHCTQFSREQRFDNILAVKSEITKGCSYLKLVLLAAALIILGVIAYIYIPKIVEKSRAEKAARLSVEFHHELDKINAETGTLCEKYKLTSLDEPVAVPAAWREDSLRYRQQLERFWSVDSLNRVAVETLQQQKQAITVSRQRDFDALKQAQILQAADSLVNQQTN